MGAWSKVMGFFGFGTVSEPIKAEPIKNKTVAKPRRSGEMFEIVTLQPKSYSEAPEIADNFRQGLPVVVNIGAMSEVEAKRILDYMVGLSAGLEGNIGRVTQKVFIISPTNIPIANSDVVAATEDLLNDS